MEQQAKPELASVTALVPAAVKRLVEQIAAAEERSTSQVVRKLIEESPRVKAALKRGKAA